MTFWQSVDIWFTIALEQRLKKCLLRFIYVLLRECICPSSDNHCHPRSTASNAILTQQKLWSVSSCPSKGLGPANSARDLLPHRRYLVSGADVTFSHKSRSVTLTEHKRSAWSPCAWSCSRAQIAGVCITTSRQQARIRFQRDQILSEVHAEKFKINSLLKSLLSAIVWWFSKPRFTFSTGYSHRWIRNAPTLWIRLRIW